MIKLSVIIPNYNKDAFIGNLLEHLAIQKTDEIEVICIDDCSTDKSWEIIQSYQNIFTTLRNQNNKYLTYTRNVGIRLAKGEYITFIDSDDDIAEDYISTILQDIDSGHDGYFYDYEILLPEGDNDPVEKGHRREVWGKAYKSSILKNNNIWFDEDVFIPGVLGEDSDFNGRFASVTDDIVVSDKPLILYRFMVEGSVSNSPQKNPVRIPAGWLWYEQNEEKAKHYFK